MARERIAQGGGDAAAVVGDDEPADAVQAGDREARAWGGDAAQEKAVNWWGY